MAAGLPNCDDYEGNIMTTMPGRLMGLLCSAGMAVLAAAQPLPAHASETRHRDSTPPVVKIGRAMLQERRTLPNGTVINSTNYPKARTTTPLNVTKTHSLVRKNKA